MLCFHLWRYYVRFSPLTSNNLLISYFPILFSLCISFYVISFRSIFQLTIFSLVVSTYFFILLIFWFIFLKHIRLTHLYILYMIIVKVEVIFVGICMFIVTVLVCFPQSAYVCLVLFFLFFLLRIHICWDFIHGIPWKFLLRAHPPRNMYFFSPSHLEH